MALHLEWLTEFCHAEPCWLGETVLERFLDELIVEYNKAQFELCDPSFRRMTRYEILNSCSNDDSNNHRDRRRLYARANPRLAYRVGGTSTAESTSYTHGNGRRRRLEKVESNQEKTLSVSTLLKKDEDETFLDANDMEEESTNQSALTSDDSSCSCSPFATDPRSITEQEFEELANQVLQRVTGGEVEVVRSSNGLFVEVVCAWSLWNRYLNFCLLFIPWILSETGSVAASVCVRCLILHIFSDPHPPCG